MSLPHGATMHPRGIRFAPTVEEAESYCPTSVQPGEFRWYSLSSPPSQGRVDSRWAPRSALTSMEREATPASPLLSRVVSHAPFSSAPVLPTFHHKQSLAPKLVPSVVPDPFEPLDFGGTAVGWNSGTSYRSLAVGLATISSCLFGYSLAGLNSCNSTIVLHFEWCGSRWNSDCPRAKLLSASINAILYVGAIAGALAAGPLVSKGRKFALQASSCIFLSGSLIGAASFGAFAWVHLLVARAIVGFAVGIVTVGAPLYISEVVDPKNRGFYGTLHQICISVGILLAVAFGLALKPNAGNIPGYRMRRFDHLWWRVILGFPLAPATASAVGLGKWIMRETPQFLVAQGRTFEAMEKLMLLQDTSNARDVEPALLDLAQSAADARTVPSLSLWAVLGDPFYRYGVLLGAFLAVVQQATGINVITSSSTALLTSAGFKGVAAAAASTAICFAGTLAPLLSGLLADRAGRRLLLLSGLLVQAATTAPIGALRWWFGGWGGAAPEVLDWATLVAMAMFTAIFSAALGPVLWIYLTEIYPAEIRAPALAACAMLNWVAGAATVFAGHFLNATSSLLAFGVASFVGFLGAAAWVIETQGCSLNDSPVSPRDQRLKGAVSGCRPNVVTREEIWTQIRLQSPIATIDTGSETFESVPRARPNSNIDEMSEDGDAVGHQWHLLTDTTGTDEETSPSNRNRLGYAGPTSRQSCSSL